MAITINLKPYPAAEYFTVKDHQRTFKTLDKYQPEGVLEGIVAMLRRFHGIPATFRVSTHHEGAMEDIRTKFENLIIKDNPVSGTNNLSGTNLQKTVQSLLDLSYSFPLTAENPADFDAIMVDPQISLGIPVDAIFLFTKQTNVDITSQGLLPAELYLVDNVLKDIERKGIELIVRETNYKAAVLYQLIEDCPYLAPLAEKKIRSKTMVATSCDRAFAEKISKMGYRIEVSGSGNTANIVIANYATHSKEMIELFSDRIMQL
jgi:hypothetical protein